MNLRRSVTVALAVVAVCAVSLVDKAVHLEREYAEVMAQAVHEDEQRINEVDRGIRLDALIETAEADEADRAGVLAVRSDFVTAVGELRTALDSGEGKIDSGTHRAAALAAQEQVLSEREDPDVVTGAAATVRALTKKVNADVAAHDAARVPAGVSSPPRAGTSGAAGYARVRAALDRVGGGGVGLYESSSCAGGQAAACANSDGYIKYRADIASWGDARLNWAMAHELAHIYQFRVWGAMSSSPSYGSLFGGDPEFLANCMAVVRGYPGSVGCNESQQVWASGIWVGVVR
ncbi:hypothetical protein [uncultured Microbacterium sp.]|uniref:hypothetical protein n=1 Tax=uncultured Microbacterium sp. TaxID=191216 RepID=UPI0026302368|nr:hypothetical protein [uncultured Microbacterium sp.]